jgi:hypothetical protein
LAMLLPDSVNVAKPSDFLDLGLRLCYAASIT